MEELLQDFLATEKSLATTGTVETAALKFVELARERGIPVNFLQARKLIRAGVVQGTTSSASSSPSAATALPQKPVASPAKASATSAGDCSASAADLAPHTDVSTSSPSKCSASPVAALLDAPPASPIKAPAPQEQASPAAVDAATSSVRTRPTVAVVAKHLPGAVQLFPSGLKDDLAKNKLIKHRKTEVAVEAFSESSEQKQSSERKQSSEQKQNDSQQSSEQKQRARPHVLSKDQKIAADTAYSFKDPSGMLEYVEDCGLRFVKCSYLEDLVRQRRQSREPNIVLKRQQDLPETAFLPHERLQELLEEADQNGSPVWAISHGWLDPKHPDPHGVHVEQIVDFFNAFREQEWRDRPEAVFMDFVCLPQVPRTTEENHRFRSALQNLQVVYGHDCVRVLRLEDVPSNSHSNRPYQERGWCYVEMLIGSTKQRHLDDYTFVVGGSDTDEALAQAMRQRASSVKAAAHFASFHVQTRVRACSAARELILCPLPPTPEIMKARLANLHFQAKAVDTDIVLNMYTKIFESRIKSAPKLEYNHRLAEDVPRICELLGACENLREFTLTGEILEAAANIEIVLAALPLQLEVLTLRTKQKPQWTEAAISGLGKLSQLRKLRLHSSSLGPNEAQALAPTLKKLILLEELLLGQNEFGVEGVRSLVDAFQHMPTLREVSFDGEAQAKAEMTERGLARLLPLSSSTSGPAKNAG